MHVEGLTKKYSNTTGIFNFSLNLTAGDRLLLLGPNGAGKTTAMSGILGLIHADAGSVDFPNSKLGHPLNRVGAMISKPVFYDRLSGLDNLKVLARFYSRVVDLDVLLDEVGLKDAKKLEVGKYSTGMRQRLDLARALMHEPEVLLLDEPFSGLDIEGKWQMRQLLERLQGSRDLAIMLSSHQLGDLEAFANRVMLVKSGRVVIEAAMDEVVATGQNLETFYLTHISGGAA